MEPILTLDLADSPAKLRVISYEDRSIKVWGESSVDLKPPTSETPIEGDEAIDPSKFFISQLSTAIEKLEPVWTSSALLVAPSSYHSINLELPFNDDKNVGKVLTLEAQDRLPFELDEFFLEHKVLTQQLDSQYDVHVSLTKKTELSKLLSDCQQAGLDPVAITTVPSLIEGLVLTQPQAFAANSVFLAFHSDKAYLAFRVAGEFKCDRAIAFANKNPSSLISEIKRSVRSVEQRYSSTFEELWVETSELPKAERYPSDYPVSPDNTAESYIAALKEELSLNIKLISSLEESNSARLADWFAFLCADGRATKLFTNFRSGQFSQTLKWGAVWKICNAAFPFFLLFVIVSFAILVSTYVSRESEIEHLQSGVIAKVQPLLGEGKLVPGQVVKAIQIANDTIEKQLKDLGSPSKFSPLDVLAEVTRDFSSVKEVSVSAVTIRGTQLTVVGSSPTYETVDAVEKVLQAKRTLYCRPTKQVSGTSTRQFTFTITLCD